MILKLISTLFISFWTFTLLSQPYTMVTYNVENLFDADRESSFKDYRYYDENGREQYTNQDVYIKIQNITKIIKRFNNGLGPDIIVFNEIESDMTPIEDRSYTNTMAQLNPFEGMSLKEILLDNPTDASLNLPAEALLLKAFQDIGINDYEFDVGYSPIGNNGKPTNPQKNVLFTRFSIQREKTRIHELYRVRPILETWLTVDGYDLVLFSIHWKSGAGSAEMENIRKDNAEVLRERLDILEKEFPHLDIILAGDFNSQYNQYQTLSSVSTNGINHILKTSGDEAKIATRQKEGYFYNLWYELPIDERSSEVYNGTWSTVMNVMLSPNLYDNNSIQYVDNSFHVKRLPGINTMQLTGVPKRWSSIGEGRGFSDHLPLVFMFTTTSANDTNSTIQLENPGIENPATWKAISVTSGNLSQISSLPTLKNLKDIDVRTDTTYYDSYFYIVALLDSRGYIDVYGKKFLIYAPTFELKQKIGKYTGKNKPMRFIGRLFLYRTTWEFVIDHSDHILD